MMDSIRKTLKSHGSYKSTTPSASDHESEQPILFNDSPSPAASPANDRREVVVKIDGNSSRNPFDAAAPQRSNIWREPSYDFWKEGHLAAPQAESGFTFKNNDPSPSPSPSAGEDPPSRLISKFLNQQKAVGTETFLDMDLEMDELKKPTVSKELRVSFQAPSLKKPTLSASSSSASSEDGRGSPVARSTSSRVEDGEVIRCTSNSSFIRRSTLLRAKTRSRLIDPPPPTSSDDDSWKSGRIPKSGPMRSGILGPLEEEDEDPFDDDLPDSFKDKLSYLTVLQWLSLVAIVTALIFSLTVAHLRRKILWGLHLWKWEVFFLILLCGRLVSGWGIRIAIFFIERNFLLRKRLLYFIYSLRKAVQNCIWLGLVLICWMALLDKRVENNTQSNIIPYVTKSLLCLLVANACRLVKTLLVKVLASSFHVSTYFDRIQESLFNQYVIETLSGPPLIEMQNSREEEEWVLAEVQKLQNAGATMPSDLRATALPSKSGRMTPPGGGIGLSQQIGRSTKLTASSSKRDIGNDGITIDQLHKLNQKNVSAWSMKRLMRIVRHGAITTLDETIPQATGEDESTMQIRSEHEAKVAAKKIFNNVAMPMAKYIYLVNIMRFMREEEAIKTMSLFEEAQETKRISRKSLKNWVVNAFRERRALALTLNDTKTAVNKLHQMANVVVGVIVFAIWLLILGLATTHFFVFLSSQLLLAVFMFGNSVKLMFEAIVFLFVMHPFDVGDRCEIDGNQMVVEEMNILTTIFLKGDNTKIIYPNTLLSTQPISNFYRSPDQGDAIDFCVHISTPLEKLALLKEKLIGFMESKKDHWYPGPNVVMKDIDDMNRLKVSIWMRHRYNFQNMGSKWTRRELVIQELIRVSKELDIEYRMLPLDVNFRNMPPVSSTRLPSNWTTSS